MNHNDINNKNLGKFFHVILEVTHLPNGIFQNVQERYTIHEVVEHPYFTNIKYPDKRFFKSFQKQATVKDEERVWLFSQWSMKMFQLRQINKFKILFFYKYVKICAEKNFFDKDFLQKHEKIRRKLPVYLYVLKTSLTHFRAMFQLCRNQVAGF